VVSTLAKAATQKDRAIPLQPGDPVFLSDRVIKEFTLLINWLSQSHVDCGCTVFLGGSPYSDLIYMILYYHKSTTLSHPTFSKVKFHSQSIASKHLSTQTFI
jgi:hypothetical protein